MIMYVKESVIDEYENRRLNEYYLLYWYLVIMIYNSDKKLFNFECLV